MQIQKITYFQLPKINIQTRNISPLNFCSQQISEPTRDEFIPSKVNETAESQNIKKKAHAIWNEIENADSIVILTHECSDGDGVGSGLALKYIIKDYFPEKKVDFIIPGGIPVKLRDIPGADSILRGNDIPEKNYDLAILVDCDDSIVDGKIFYKNAKKKVDFDHHPSNKEHSSRDNIVLKDKEASSNTEVIYNKFIKPLDIKLSPEAAECLLTGLITDTDSFQHLKNKHRSLETRDELLDYLDNYDISTYTINETIALNDTISEGLENLCDDILDNKLIRKTQTKYDEEIAYVIVDKKKIEKYKITDSTTDIKAKLTKINYKIKENNSAEFAVIFLEPTDGKIRVSMRSKHTKIDKFAKKLGGGGHEYATGMTLEGEKKEAISKFLNELKNYNFEEELD